MNRCKPSKHKSGKWHSRHEGRIATPIALVLFSGGIDSSACVRYYLEQRYSVTGLFVRFGQASMLMEWKAAGKLARHFGIPLKEIDVSGIPWQGQIPFELQGRNALLASVGLCAFPGKSGLVSMGLHAGTPFPDCSTQFQVMASNLAQISTQGRIAFDFPFGASDKSQIVAYCQRMGVPIELTYSCQRGKKMNCGICPSCLDRQSFLGAHNK